MSTVKKYTSAAALAAQNRRVRRLKEQGKTADEIAKEIGRSIDHVTHLLTLVKKSETTFSYEREGMPFLY